MQTNPPSMSKTIALVTYNFECKTVMINLEEINDLLDIIHNFIKKGMWDRRDIYEL